MISFLPYLYLICIVLITRLFFQFRDNPITLKHNIYKTIIESIALFIFEWNYWLLIIFFVVIILNAFNYQIEKRDSQLKLSRLIFLLLYLTLFSFFFSARINIHFNPGLFNSFLNLESNFIIIAFLKRVDWTYFFMVSSGLLLVLNEANIFIRYLMESLHLVPHLKLRKKTQEIDSQEYNRGRVIGILERILIYFFVLNNHLAAVGFILTAKGITRFKELENREFAEYFLIGTLLSSIISGAIALLIRGII